MRPGDAVAAFLPELGGYAGQLLARYWVKVAEAVSAQQAAALPASGEAATRVVDEVRVAPGETVLVVGAAGSVGLIASQLVVARGARVLAAVRPDDFGIVTKAGWTPVATGAGLPANVRAIAGSVDAVIDAAGAGVLGAAVELAGGPDRVVTLSDPHAGDFGVRLSGPDGPHITRRLQEVMAPLADAARVHRDLENHQLRAKVLLSAHA